MSLIPDHAPTITTSASAVAGEPELLIPAAPRPMISRPAVSITGAPEQTAAYAQPMISVALTTETAQARR